MGESPIVNSGLRPIVWAIGGGKGGAGKTFISTNLAMSLAKLGHSVTLVDLDLGGANAHTHLGVPGSERCLSDFLNGNVEDLNSLVLPTDIPRLKMISGFNDSLNVADVPDEKRRSLIEQILQLKSPYIILDLGAGTSEAILDFFLSADKRIVAATPEPTSIENSYRFIRASLYRALKKLDLDPKVAELVESAIENGGNTGLRTPQDLIRAAAKVDEASSIRISDAIAGFEIMLLLNQVRSRSDADLGHSIKSVCRKYFGIEVDYVAPLNFDNAVWQSLRKKKPLFTEHPYSRVVGQFLGATRHLVDPQKLKAVV